MNLFSYDPVVRMRYPGLATRLVRVAGATNGDSSAALRNELATEVAAARMRLALTPAAELPSIAAWRRVFTSFGTKPTQYRNAAEALLRRVGSAGELPSLNTMTDIGNLVSIRHAVPVAVLDLAGVTGAITVRVADGTERFTGVGTDEATSPDHGEVVFADGAGVLHARRWCWRQSLASACNSSTTNALIVIEAHHDSAQQSVAAAATDVVELLHRHQPTATLTIEQR